jgi:peroxiredoxin
LADYAKHYQEIRAAGTDVVVVAVDPPEKSEAVRRELGLPFAILSDRNKRVVQDWDIYNPKERGGIARPAVFIINRSRMVLFASVDTVNARVPTTEIVRILQTRERAPSAGRKGYFPRPMDFVRAIRNGIRLRSR